MKALTHVEMMAALQECIDRLGPPRIPRHPETGCPCVQCDDRDSRLEQRAEDRADVRAGLWSSGRDADIRAG